MRYDSFVSPKSNKEIEELASAWRIALGIQDQLAPDMARLIENNLPVLLSDYGFSVRLEEPNGLLFEAFTAFDPTEIVFSPVTYDRLVKWEARKIYGGARIRAFGDALC